MEYQETHESNENQVVHSVQAMHAIYLSLSENIETDFDVIDENYMMLETFNTIFTDELRHLPTKDLIGNRILLNETFAQFLKYSIQKYNYRKYGKMFIYYCDYFDLDYHAVFNLLQEKIKDVIRRDLIRLIGMTRYQKLNAKHNPMFTLFDL